MNRTAWEKCVEFHGHICPGLATGFKVTELALVELGVERAQDEELVAIIETDACGVDAVQVLAGCSVGKGNLFLRDFGKPVYTLGSRTTGRAVRVAVDRRSAPDDPAMNDLRAKLGRGGGTRDERELLRQKMLALAEQILVTPAIKYCKVEFIQLDFPERARIMKSVTCEQCGETVMETKTRIKDGHKVCLPCAKEEK
ncbi:MAG TPA: FmdE family protein [Bacillota bacterium]|nr:FmdE family protein [Bacillota bacterium]